eukprot:6460174-Amphidinium_carterae.1
MLLLANHDKTVFVGSDSLLELDARFDIVKRKAGSMVVYLTRDTLTQPWCVGEACIAIEYRLPLVKVQTGSWERPSEANIADMPSVMDRKACNLQELGITEELVARCLRCIAGDELPTISLDHLCPGGARYTKLAGELASLERTDNQNFGEALPTSLFERILRSTSGLRKGMHPLPLHDGVAKKKDIANTTQNLIARLPAPRLTCHPGCLVACADPEDDEAVAT